MGSGRIGSYRHKYSYGELKLRLNFYKENTIDSLLLWMRVINFCSVIIYIFISYLIAFFQGKLSSVWLGGLVNPNALLRALCHEKAVAQDTPTEKVSWILHFITTGYCKSCSVCARYLVTAFAVTYLDDHSLCFAGTIFLCFQLSILTTNQIKCPLTVYLPG